MLIIIIITRHHAFSTMPEKKCHKNIVGITEDKHVIGSSLTICPNSTADLVSDFYYFITYSTSSHKNLKQYTKEKAVHLSH